MKAKTKRPAYRFIDQIRVFFHMGTGCKTVQLISHLKVEHSLTGLLLLLLVDFFAENIENELHISLNLDGLFL